MLSVEDFTTLPAHHVYASLVRDNAVPALGLRRDQTSTGRHAAIPTRSAAAVASATANHASDIEGRIRRTPQRRRQGRRRR